MKVYLASPANQLQAHAASDMPVLMSYANYRPWMDKYISSYSSLLIDSGAFSAFNSGRVIDPREMWDWAEKFRDQAVAIAAVDDITCWKRSLLNYEIGFGFPTYHDSDPFELLEDILIPMSRERGNWLGIGLVPPRTGKLDFLRRTLDRIPDDIKVHGWALREYQHLPKINSVDSTNWFRDAWTLMTNMPWLTYGETLDIVIKRYRREEITKSDSDVEQALFDYA